ncbi:carbohydrate ABC transporter membrane protein 1 (CUT1 family) [Microterricola gilva]|uniref:Carbohydrate ABC transporter membrane protein 1 (CUT1 family) n=1 Tax=Microterricola gilva TaxID=393267 RepID=A0A4Q8ASR0_9MICO|nr:sugar ABC transporter permease [Microterricola gilva]RZU67089.1 carbohydrate ABC transporter membrane protein 1 (CUT1 family) [Microterricola gilva]
MARSRIKWQGTVAGSLMFAPYFILLVAFGIVPVVMALVTSLQPSRLNLGGGFANYLTVLQDFRFLPALINVAVFVLIYVPLMVIVVSLMSLLLDAVRSRWTVGLRAAYIVPAAISGAVSILVWYFMLEPTYSPYRDLLHAVGITEGSQIWAKPNLMLIFVMMAFATGAGNWIIVQYGSLQSIPDEILEAARIDGANGAQIALKIKLPLIRKYLVYMAILTFAAGLQVFVEPYLISSSVYTGLAKDWSLNQLSYAFAFESGDLAAASALSLMLLAVCVIFALIAIFKTDFFDESGVTKK